MTHRRRRRDASPAGAPPSPAVEARIESLSHEGRGVAHVGGKTTFVEGGLPGETVELRYLRRRGRFDEAIVTAVLVAAATRREPGCVHYGMCGGCALQHLEPAAQIAHKQGVLLEQLRHAAGVAPAAILPPLVAAPWGYRRKARLGVRRVPKKGGVLVGFRERHSPYVAVLDACPVLAPAASALIPALKAMIGSLSVSDRVPQVEVAVTDDAVALLLRHLAPLTAADGQVLAAFAAGHGVDLWLQPDGPASVHPLDGTAPRPLAYRLPHHDVEIRFGPADFTQVNFEINAQLVDRVVELLAPRADEHLLDLFCGLGNFTLPLARRAGAILGVEGDAGLVGRARENARHNGIANATFEVADLAGTPRLLTDTGYARVLLDPPRSGAESVVRTLNLDALERMVYVSCNPATLARDAGILVRERGLTLVQAGVMDMFPHTAHVESIAVFER